jgi:hypothetical protein
MDTLPKLTMSDLDAAEARRAQAFEQRTHFARIDTRDDAANLIYLHATRRSMCVAPSLCDHGERCPPDCRERQEQIDQSEAPSPAARLLVPGAGPYKPHRPGLLRRWLQRVLDYWETL